MKRRRVGKGRTYELIGTDFVCCVSVCGDAIGADHDGCYSFGGTFEFE